MNGIKMSDCKFYVNKDEGVVVCVIPDTRTILRDFIYDNFQFKDIGIWDALGYDFNQELNMPNSFMGKAVCAKEDEWDEETGRLIAYSRAKDKCYKSFFKRANMLVQRVDRRIGDMIETFNDFGMKLEDKRINLQKTIDDKMGLNIDE